MKSILWMQILIGIVVISSAKNTTKETKEKRQIHQTRITSSQHNQDVHRQLDAIYGGSRSGQYLIRPSSQGQGGQQQHQLQQVHYRPQQQQYQGPSESQQQELQSDHFPYFPEIGQQVQTLQQSAGENQYLTHSSPDQRQIEILGEEGLLKLLQDELATRGPAAGRTQQKAKTAATTPGLGNYREQNRAENSQGNSYVQVPYPQQQYIQQESVDYHRSLPDHPLSQSSFEKELEKLVASNKPSINQQGGGGQREIYRPSKVQPLKSYSTTEAPIPNEKPYPLVPDLSQFSSFKPQSSSFYQQEFADPSDYSAEGPEQYQKFSQINPNAGQYLSEVAPKQNLKSNQSPFHQRPHYYAQIEKDNAQSQSVNSQAKNNAIQFVPSPVLQYDNSQANESPEVAAYYKSQNFEKPTQQSQQQQQQSHSSIFVAQGTGVRPLPKPHQPQLPKPYPNEKAPPRLPQDGKVITEAEFQALVEAGYPVEAVHVPVPVPYENFIKNQPQSQYQFRPQQQKTFRRQVKPQRQGVTYLRPLHLANPDVRGRPSS